MDREDGQKNYLTKRNRNNVSKREGAIGAKNRRIKSSGRVLGNARNRFILRTTPSYVSIPPNGNGTMAKDELVR